MAPEEDVEDHIIVVLGEWKLGIVGLLASKLCEKYARPAVVCTQGSDHGLCVGSARSIRGYDISEGIHACEEHLQTHGGHPAAAGFSLEADAFERFRLALIDHANANISAEALQPVLDIDLMLKPADLTLDTVEQLAALEPFGNGHRRPVFAIEDCRVVWSRQIGTDGRHFKAELEVGGRRCTALWWNQKDLADQVRPGDRLNAASSWRQTPILATVLCRWSSRTCTCGSRWFRWLAAELENENVISSQYAKELCIRDSDAKIVLLVVDGLGGLPHPAMGKSELETARLPNLDALAKGGTCGLISPLGAGFTPGSGPAHLALFGYDPWQNQIGRGALSALGLGLDFARGDVAARLNFCTVNAAGRVCDRRAGRIPTEKGRQLCEVLRGIAVPGGGGASRRRDGVPRRRGVARRGLGRPSLGFGPTGNGRAAQALVGTRAGFRAHRRSGQCLSRPSRRLARRRAPGQHGAAAGIWSLPRVGVDGRGVRAESPGHCRISHVPRGGPALWAWMWKRSAGTSNPSSPC